MSNRGNLFVIAATNRPNAIDPALRRPGRLDREVAVPVPDVAERTEILQHLFASSPGVDCTSLAVACVGFVGADLEELRRQVVLQSVATGTTLTTADVLRAADALTPSTQRNEFNVAKPDVTWSSVGGLEDIKARLTESIQWPLEHAAVLRRFNIKSSSGVLLHGPPGCSKTTLVRAAANASQVPSRPLILGLLPLD